VLYGTLNIAMFGLSSNLITALKYFKAIRIVVKYFISTSLFSEFYQGKKK
jgi:hypothetical protein